METLPNERKKEKGRHVVLLANGWIANPGNIKAISKEVCAMENRKEGEEGMKQTSSLTKVSMKPFCFRLLHFPQYFSGVAFAS